MCYPCGLVLRSEVYWPLIFKWSLISDGHNSHFVLALNNAHTSLCTRHIQHYCSQPDVPLSSSMEPCTVVGKPARERGYSSERTWSEWPPTAPPASIDLFLPWTRHLSRQAAKDSKICLCSTTWCFAQDDRTSLVFIGEL